MRRAQRIRQVDQLDRDRILAWSVIYVWIKTQNQSGRMPTIGELLQLGKGPRRQTPAQQRAVLYQLSEQYGIPIKVKTA